LRGNIGERGLLGRGKEIQNSIQAANVIWHWLGKNSPGNAERKRKHLETLKKESGLKNRRDRYNV